jgi:hypothetical protein
MEIDVGSESAVIDGVETVEVVASGDDIPIPVTSTAAGGVGLMEHHMMVTSPEGILVPTSEVSGWVQRAAVLMKLDRSVL